MALSLLNTCRVWYLKHQEELSKLNIEELPYIISDALTRVKLCLPCFNTTIVCYATLKNGVIDDIIDGKNELYVIHREYKNGILHGAYTIHETSGIYREIGEYRNGHKVGLYKENMPLSHLKVNTSYDDNGNILSIEGFTQDVLKRKTEFNGDNMTIYEYDTPYTYIHQEIGYIYNGFWRQYKGDKLITEKYYKDGQLDGTFTEWYSDGRIEQTTYKKGEKDGPEIYKYPNGKPSCICSYVNGIREGLYQLFNENGLMITVCTYSKGKYNGRRTDWFANGNIQFDGYYIHGVEEGTCIVNNADGTPYMIKNYKDGNEYGLQQYYTGPNHGVLTSEWTVKNRKFIGQLIVNYDDGRPKKREFYNDNGVRIGHFEFDNEGLPTLEEKLENNYIYTMRYIHGEGIMRCCRMESDLVYVKIYKDSKLIYEINYTDKKSFTEKYWNMQRELLSYAICINDNIIMIISNPIPRELIDYCKDNATEFTIGKICIT